MKMLWNREPMFVREMLELYPEPKPHFNTVSTLVRLMEQKGFVGHEAFGNSYRHFSCITEAEYSRSALRNIIARYFKNSMKNVVSALVEDEKLTHHRLNRAQYPLSRRSCMQSAYIVQAARAIVNTQSLIKGGARTNRTPP